MDQPRELRSVLAAAAESEMNSGQYSPRAALFVSQATAPPSLTPPVPSCAFLVQLAPATAKAQSLAVSDDTARAQSNAAARTARGVALAVAGAVARAVRDALAIANAVSIVSGLALMAAPHAC
jgi:hypothetical protein